ncbi:MAG: rhodanese-like domain-containing protein [bacterium]
MKIIDVRTKEEFDQEHLSEAINIDVNDIVRGKFPDLSKDTQILLYCASGARSMYAKNFLESCGFINITNGGSIYTLKAQGYKS